MEHWLNGAYPNSNVPPCKICGIVDHMIVECRVGMSSNGQSSNVNVLNISIILKEGILFLILVKRVEDQSLLLVSIFKLIFVFFFFNEIMQKCVEYCKKNPKKI